MLETADHPLRIETARFGPFTFRLGVDPAALQVALVRAQDAHRRFVASPLAQVATGLEREVLVDSVHGTNTIEGADLTPDETGALLALPPEQLRSTRELRVRNIRAAYNLALASSADARWQPTVDWIRAMHAEVCRDLADADNLPGLLRDTPDGRMTYVGDSAHGGRYKPPQLGRDIRHLLQALMEWHGGLVDAGVPALIRAPLMHLYFERIHPFWDGNGRVGRLVEATLLLQEGFRYAPFALWRYYLDNVDEYFTLLNVCRKAEAAGHAHPNQDFVRYHLEGMRVTLERLHDRVNRMVGLLLFDADLVRALERREINAREYAVVRRVLDHGAPLPLTELRRTVQYRQLYRDLTEKTMQRDLRRLREKKWLHVDSEGRLWPGLLSPPESGLG